ncbi:hypothetical protein TrVE_jg3271 [Triparma verrucosa]|uniref:Cwf15/Cwc15 cell cycle control protein n=2 Tax=Triparma TaxID=722752 RepID=A0A9W7BRK5_9STRA|nr:hypothetical protein TrVE_jg3271 [Triparma verrucosa]GMH92437.1 hypothetical protein TrST_g1892 [Triparma strigata]
MTTAHRPTWKAAVGAGEGGNWSSGGAQSHMRSAKDAAAFTKIKYRERGVRKEGEVLVEESLRRLEEAERKEKELKKIGKRQVRESDDVESSVKLLKVQGEGVDVSVLDKFDDADSGDEGGEEEEESDLDDSDDSDEDEGSDDDEDEEELLRLEMEKIKKERAAAALALREKEALEAEATATSIAMTGNPLLSTSGSGKMKRKWNDDVVFRNQSRKEKGEEKRFINDTVRNDFHKRFMEQYMK